MNREGLAALKKEQAEREENNQNPWTFKEIAQGNMLGIRRVISPVDLRTNGQFAGKFYLPGRVWQAKWAKIICQTHTNQTSVMLTDLTVSYKKTRINPCITVPSEFFLYWRPTSVGLFLVNWVISAFQKSHLVSFYTLHQYIFLK